MFLFSQMFYTFPMLFFFGINSYKQQTKPTKKSTEREE